MNKLKIGIGIIILVIAFAMYWSYNQTIVLKVGVFAGSNWDVPNGSGYKLIDTAIARFEEEHPNVKIEYKSGILKEDYSLWLADQIIEGNEPDVFIVLGDDFNTLSSVGALKDLTSLIENDKSFDINNYYGSVLKIGQYEGNQYALPYESNPKLMFVNKTLLEKEGIPMPKNDWTLDDFYDICKKVTKDSDGDGIIDQYGCYNFTWIDAINGYNLRLFNEDGTACYLNRDEVKEALTFMKNLNELNQGYNVKANDFDKGKIVFAPMPFSQYRAYKPYPWSIKKYSTFEWDCVRMPVAKNKKHVSEVSSLLMAISSRTTHSKEAWDFLKMLTYNEQSQKDLFQYSQGVSSLKSVIRSDEVNNLLNKDKLQESQVNMNLLDDVMESAVTAGQFKKYDTALSIMDRNIREIIQDNDDLDMSLIDLQKEVNKYLRN